MSPARPNRAGRGRRSSDDERAGGVSADRTDRGDDGDGAGSAGRSQSPRQRAAHDADSLDDGAVAFALRGVDPFAFAFGAALRPPARFTMASTILVASAVV